MLDAGVLIGFLDRSDAHHEAASAVLAEADAQNEQLVMPASAFAEVLVGPSRRGRGAVATVERLVERLPIEIAPLDAEIAKVAAGLRARHRSLNLPDALVIATAEHLGAHRLVATDRGWPSRAKLRVGVAITEI